MEKDIKNNNIFCNFILTNIFIYDKIMAIFRGRMKLS